MTDYLRFEIGEEPPDIITIVIEISSDGSNKYENDKKRDRFQLDRIQHSTGHFPADCKFIPQTRGEDANPRNSLMLGELLMFPDCVYDASRIGSFSMIDPGAFSEKSFHIPRESPLQRHNRILRGMLASFRDG